MKRIIYITSLILFGTLLLTQCSDDESPDQLTAQENPTIDSKLNFNIENSSIAHNVISIQKGISMFNDYDKTRMKPNQNNLRNQLNDPNFTDTKFVWYSLKQIKDYVKFLEQVQRENPNETISGIRIYFASYPNKDGFSNSNSQSVFFAPTMHSNLSPENPTLSQVPFYIQPSDASKPYKGDFVLLNQLMVGERKAERINKFSQQTGYEMSSTNTNPIPNDSVNLAFESGNYTSLLLNEGAMCPPCPPRSN